MNDSAMFAASEAGGGVDSAFIIYRLEEAGTTLLSLPGTGYSTRLRVSQLEVLQEVVEAHGGDRGRVRPAVPGAARITRMDEALAWITMIPKERYVAEIGTGKPRGQIPGGNRHPTYI